MARFRTPSVLQLEAAECGAAALAMILGFHGRFVALDELRTLCGVSRDGSKASSILRAARTFGLEARGMKAEPEHLNALDLPAIAFVNFSHFVVVEAIDAAHVWLNDPATGRRRETRAAFSDSFTGVVLVFRRGADFRPGDTRPSLLASLRGRFEAVGEALVYVILVSLALVIPGIVLPVFSRIFIDYVLIRSLHDWLGPLLAGMALPALVRFVLIQLERQTLLKARMVMSLTTGNALMSKLMTLPISFFDQRFAGEVADRLRINEALSDLLTGRLAQAVVSLLSAAFFLVVMLIYSWGMTLAVLILALSNVAVLLVANRYLSEHYRKVSIDQGKLAGARVAGLKDMETFKASGAEDMLFARWTGLATVAQNGAQSAAAITAWIAPIPALIGVLITVTILVWGGFLVIGGQMSLGGLVGYQILAASFIAPVTALAGFGAELHQIRNYTGRLDDILAQRSDVRFAAPDPVFDGRLPRGSVRLQDVEFGYAPLDPPLIARLSLDLRPGVRIALVGASGSGKSTLGKLIAGLEQPMTGAILIDGRPAVDWPRAALAARLAYVRQDVMLFEGTIRENLTLWNPALPEPDMIRAAKDAQIHEVIAARPGGYDSRVAEGGGNFSGGEKQRIDIARALATNPAVLVLDEATSALDPVSEYRVMEALRRRGVTCVVIAHRLSTIRDCDEIIVLERGQVIERGDHPALLAAGGVYAGLLEA
ncbi:NHLP family bacteriocin export ABC transporter peptidase/permease/ATPase subunit [uncultured Phenylobacterium sp.]|uniref:NHLP family bacteriocin export ABC transporter peptidase/permease/ATPase subunit n=1 Tax=uncultured Phenylobacterium sp. TaxID=349273 RepID=UPI0025D71919|nr:NHLP family bacteriocin export ABC transporter peptidase/permease/ATPase subunit [uncultured Phenylobacterium sp.]